MRRYVVERTDGKTDDILAERYVIRAEDGIVVFEGADNSVFTYYILSNIVKITVLGEVKEEEQAEEPERRKNENEDLISRSGLLNFLKSHWSSNVIEVIQTFEKAEYLD